MPKINVYVPDELLTRVRAEEISVSAVCQRALDTEVASRELARTATTNLQAVAARLRATEDVARAKKYRDGYTHGAAWARDMAAMAELRRVARAAHRDMYVEHRTLPTLAAYLKDAAPDTSVGSDDALDGDKSAFDEGVLNGAAEVYRNVEALVEEGPGTER